MISIQGDSVWRNYSAVRIHGAGAGMSQPAPFLSTDLLDCTNNLLLED